MKLTLSSAVAVAMAVVPSLAMAQVTFDSPLARRPSPNMMVMIASDRTNSITAGTCQGGHCHASGAEFPKAHPGDIWTRGETRIQVVRRALTGGYGVDTARLAPDGGSADALVRTDGVMDSYKVRWGVAWYDGLGARLAIDPTADNEASQRAVVNYGQPHNDYFAYRPQHGTGTIYNDEPGLNSFDLFPFTMHSGSRFKATYDPWVSAYEIPWQDLRVARAGGRMVRALNWIEDYYAVSRNAPAFDPAGGAEGYPMWFSPGPVPQDASVIDSDTANVLVSSGAAGCRKNFAVLLSDGHGTGDFGGRTLAQSTKGIYDLGAGVVDANEQTQVFNIHVGDWAPADTVADYGWDGAPGGALGTNVSFNAAPNGTLSLPTLLSAFGAIFSLVLAGDYSGVAPTFTRAGTTLCGSARCDYMVVSDFKIFNCAGASPARCNLGRPSGLKYVRVDPVTGAFVGGYPATCTYPNCIDMSQMLRERSYADRKILTTPPTGVAFAATETNCGTAATCASKTAKAAAIDTAIPVTHPLRSQINFLKGDPQARFVPDLMLGAIPFSARRGDTDMNNFDEATPNDPYKLANIANSRPIFVGAPPGVAEPKDKWATFRNKAIPRTGKPALKVAARDRVMYVGANDGFLRAFFVGEASGTPLAGATASYKLTGTACSGPSQNTPCDGSEMWAYSPRMVQNNWEKIRGGHSYSVDGTPVVDDVLFTFGSTNKALWEFRTVLVQCLGAGGPGCFAMDVTDPWNPKLLWERELTAVPGKGASTSQPVIARVKRTVSGVTVPYHVAFMGGGQNEAGSEGRKGSFIGIGLEDGKVFTSASCDPLSEAGCADFAAPPTCLDANNDGYVETCYVPTTFASVYKARITNGNPGSGIQIQEFFRGCDATAGNTCNLGMTTSNPSKLRAFTKISATSDANNRLFLVFGTGNIEDAANSAERNYLFKFFDENPSAGLTSWTPALNTARQSSVCQSVPSGLTQTNGGSFRLSNGEKVLFSPVNVSGSILFTTYQPNPNPCIVGAGFLYGLRYDSCDSGLDTNNDGHTDATRVPLGAQLPGEVAANYGTGHIYIADTGRRDVVVADPAKPPPPSKFRLQKLDWIRR